MADRRVAKLRRAEELGVDVDDLSAGEELNSSDWSGSEHEMLDDEGNPWPRGQAISLDEGMGGYIPYNIDQIHVLPPAAAPAVLMTKDSAEAHERVLSSKSPGQDRLAAQQAEELRRQSNKAAKEQLDQNRAAA